MKAKLKGGGEFSLKCACSVDRKLQLPVLQPWQYVVVPHLQSKTVMNQGYKGWYSTPDEQACQGLATALFGALSIAWQRKEKSLHSAINLSVLSPAWNS